MITKIQEAFWASTDKHQPAIMEVSGVRFFSLDPVDKRNAAEINSAANEVMALQCPNPPKV